MAPSSPYPLLPFPPLSSFLSSSLSPPSPNNFHPSFTPLPPSLFCSYYLFSLPVPLFSPLFYLNIFLTYRPPTLLPPPLALTSASLPLPFPHLLPLSLCLNSRFDSLLPSSISPLSPCPLPHRPRPRRDQRLRETGILELSGAINKRSSSYGDAREEEACRKGQSSIRGSNKIDLEAILSNCGANGP